jgi:hypothetical protein
MNVPIQATTVRWAAAKGIGRIAERLPPDFTEQVIDMIISSFSQHSAAMASTYDLPEIAEATWHGACLALAELARRGLIIDNKLREFMSWTVKVSTFVVLSCCWTERLCRPSILISGKDRILLDQVYETQQRMLYGPRHALKMLRHSNLMP